MSIVNPNSKPILPFFISGNAQCPYTLNNAEQKIFTHLTTDTRVNDEINSLLTKVGFRRSQSIVYKPACTTCNHCIPVRINVKNFKLSPSLKRVTIKNKDLSFFLSSSPPENLYPLFKEYEQKRHAESDMAGMTGDEFSAMIKEGNVSSQVYELQPTKEDKSIMGAILVDRLQDGLSAVYSFYRTNEPKRSLGTHLILSLITEANNQGLPYVYLGYWIENSRKMAYKNRFPALEKLGPQGWYSTLKD